MISLKKVYIQNYKGINKRQIVDFTDISLSILDGPNGFGKTTIFDAIELCMRGRIERTVKYDYVTKKNQNHRKAFYQNTAGEDVILKIWLFDSSKNTDHIIIKYLNKEHDGKIGTSKAFRPDSWDIIKTFYSTNISDFENTPEFSELTETEQSEIDQIFFADKGLSLVSLYPLFNYLQQEENIYFLKKDEEEKKHELNFLFQTQNDVADLEKVEAFLKNVRSNIAELQTKISDLGDVSQTSASVAFKKIFENKDFLFDKEDPFSEVPLNILSATYDRIIKELDELILFLENFDLEEFKKWKLKESFSAIINNENYLFSFVLQNFFEESTLAEYQKKKEANDIYTKYLDKVKLFEIDDEVLAKLGFDASFIDAFKQSLTQKKSLESEIGELGQIIADLNISREKVVENYFKLNEKSPQDPNCPLCNSEWKSIEELTDAVLRKTDLLKSFNEAKITALEAVIRTLNTEYVSVVSLKTTEILSSESNAFDEEFYAKISETKGFKEIIIRFNKLIEEYKIEYDRFIIKTPVKYDELVGFKNQFKEDLITRRDGIVINEEKILNKRLYKDIFDENEEALTSVSLEDLKNKRSYIFQQYQTSKFSSLNILQERLALFTAIESRVDKVYKVLDKAIKKYKMDMIDKIKIPFYIYSGKILQNYQQGHGIFVDMQETTNRVRFLTDNSSDHDIIHHLSSGQLAVVSIAFCLALNKVYNTNSQFKFIAIDDPVQTMDEINVHSFIELLRHEFKAFQLIISTHEDNVANYMAYKFKKFGFTCERQKVQQLFYSSIEE